MQSIYSKSPAKINLCLQINGKRSDGFHNLNTLMQTIDLFDEIWIQKTKIRELTCLCSDETLPVGFNNVAVRAAFEFFKFIGKEPRVKIRILKKIPNRAGLGGASSNAAEVLIGLNKLFETNLTKQNLCSIAKNVGADVSFFIFKETAVVRGFGNIVIPIKPITHCWFLIVKPKNLNISTKQAFLKHDLNSKFKKNKGQSNIFKITEKIKLGKDILNYCGEFFNDFEKSLNLTEIFKIKFKLKELGAYCALLTGSGSSVFAIFKDRISAEQASDLFSSQTYFKVICEPI